MLARPCPICHEASARHERDVNGKELARCDKCGFVYANLPDRTIADANAAMGNEVSHYYGATQADLDQAWFARIAARFSRSGARVLDVGCGNGLLIEAFRRRGCVVEGLDPSPWARAAAIEKQFVLHSGFVDEDTLPVGSYDIVAATSTFEHAADPLQFVRGLLRLVRPGGILYLCGMPNYGSWAVRFGLASFRHNNPPWHASFFTPLTLRSVFESPEIRPFVDRIKIRTYGVPELHHYYSRAMRWRRRAAVGGNRRPGKLADVGSNTLHGLAIAAYIGLGRPFRLGDKLEVTVRRSDGAWMSLKPRE
jgi:SAM-dependent methyltransferase